MRGCNTGELAVGDSDSDLGLGHECRKLNMMH
jgi:hypothetical protein